MDAGAPRGALSGGDDAAGPGQRGGSIVQAFGDRCGFVLRGKSGADGDGAAYTGALRLTQGWATWLSGGSWWAIRAGWCRFPT